MQGTQIGRGRVGCGAAGRFERGCVLEVGANKALLFFGGGVERCVAAVGDGVVVVIAPFSLFWMLEMRGPSSRGRSESHEVVCEFKAGEVGVGVFEVDDYKLLVFVCREEERRFS